MRCSKCSEPVLFLSLCKQHWQEFWNGTSVGYLNDDSELLTMISKTLAPWVSESRFYVASCCGRLFIGIAESTKCASCGSIPVCRVFDKNVGKFLE